MSDCDSRTSTTPSWASNLIRWTKACCYTPVDAALNIYAALVDIATAIREYTNAVTAKGYAVSCLHFRIAGGDSLTNGDLIDEILAVSAFNNKIVGFGASILDYPNSAGADPNDDVLGVRLYDYTAGSYISDELSLTKAQAHGSHTDDGNAIGDNISTGHKFGVKINYSNDDGGAFTMPDIDIFIYCEPQELTFSS